MVLRGLEYLHEQSNPPVVHRDIRSCNILLDSNLNAKVRPICEPFEVDMNNASTLCGV